MKITLIIHTSVNVPKGTCYGWTDVPLADTFEQEAAQTKAVLDTKVFDCVYSSPLTRARKLAAYCGYKHPLTDNRLKEMNMGDWEMQRFDEIKDNNLKKWYEDYIHTPTTNGESFETFYQRVASFLDELKQRDLQQVAIFAHGGVLMCAGIYAKLFNTDNCFEHQVGYGGIEEIEI